MAASLFSMPKPTEDESALLDANGAAAEVLEAPEAARDSSVLPCRSHGKLAMVALAALGLVAFATAAFGGQRSHLRGPAETPNHASGFIALSTQDGGVTTSQSTSLTKQYIKLRMANDVDGLKAIIAPDAKMHIDLSGASFILAAKVKMSPGTDLVGPDGFARYYKEYPSESGDVPPNPQNLKEFNCAGSSCMLHEKVDRFPLTVRTAADFTWNSAGKLASLNVAMSG